MTTAYFATAKGPLGHGEHLYRDVAAQPDFAGSCWRPATGCSARRIPGTPPCTGRRSARSTPTGPATRPSPRRSAQCARDLIELASAVYGIDLTARRLLSVRALADAFAAFRWGALLRRHGVSAMEFPYSVAGLTAQHQKMHWPVIDDPAAPDRPGARFREPFGAVPVVLSLDYPATVLTDRKRRQPPCSASFLAPTPVQPTGRPGRSPRSARDRAAGRRAVCARPGRRAAVGRRGRRSVPSDHRDGGTTPRPRATVAAATLAPVRPALGQGDDRARHRAGVLPPRRRLGGAGRAVGGAAPVLAPTSTCRMSRSAGRGRRLPPTPWSGRIVLQKIEGIDKPALGTANFDFTFTRKVTKNIGFLPCWYSATFAAVGRASATVDLNPGAAWWKSSTGHYQLRVLSKPAGSDSRKTRHHHGAATPPAAPVGP